MGGIYMAADKTIKNELKGEAKEKYFRDVCNGKLKVMGTILILESQGVYTNVILCTILIHS